MNKIIYEFCKECDTSMPHDLNISCELISEDSIVIVGYLKCTYCGNIKKRYYKEHALEDIEKNA